MKFVPIINCFLLSFLLVGTAYWHPTPPESYYALFGALYFALGGYGKYKKLTGSGFI